jgi:hypothetical protein
VLTDADFLLALDELNAKNDALGVKKLRIERRGRLLRLIGGTEEQHRILKDTLVRVADKLVTD